MWRCLRPGRHCLSRWGEIGVRRFAHKDSDHRGSASFAPCPALVSYEHAITHQTLIPVVSVFVLRVFRPIPR